MTTDFIPDKAYLIKSKSVEQVKTEIKEWFYKNNFQVLEEGKNEIQGLKIPFLAGYNIWLYIKLKSITGGTLIVFNNKYVTKIYEWNVYFSPHLRSHIKEWPKNLVRFLSDRKELRLEYFTRSQYYSLVISFASFFFYCLFYNSVTIFNKTVPCISLFFVTMFFVGLTSYSFLPFRLSQANLPEYKVEEYKGDVDI